MAQVGNWVIENTSTTGQGTITLGGSPTSFVRFRDDLVPGRVWYTIQDGENRESGTGDFDGVATLIRDDIRNTYENGVFDDAPIVGITLSGDSIVACTFNASAFVDWTDDPIISGFVLENDTFMQGRNNINSANIDIVKVNTSDQIEFGAVHVLMPLRLGIGVGLSPDYALHVGANSPGTLGAALQNFSATGFGTLITVGGTGTNYALSVKGAVTTGVNGTDLLVVLSNGSVAIPNGDLTVTTGDILFTNGGNHDINMRVANAGTAYLRMTEGATLDQFGVSMSYDGLTTNTGSLRYHNGSTTGTASLTWDPNSNVTIPNGTLTVNGSLSVVGARSSFEAANEAFAIGAKYGPGGDFVYFGADAATSTPAAVISNASGTALITAAFSGDVAINNGKLTLPRGQGNGLNFDRSGTSYEAFWQDTATTDELYIDNVHQKGINLRVNTFASPLIGLTVGGTGDVTIPNGRLTVNTSETGLAAALQNFGTAGFGTLVSTGHTGTNYAFAVKSNVLSGTNGTDVLLALGNGNITIPNGDLTVAVGDILCPRVISVTNTNDAEIGIYIRDNGFLYQAKPVANNANASFELNTPGYIAAGGATDAKIRFRTTGNTAGTITCSNTTTTYGTTSDPRLKSAFREIDPEAANALITEAHDQQMIGEFDWLDGSGTMWGYNAHKLIDSQNTFGGVEGEGSRTAALDNDLVMPAGVDQSKRVPMLEASIYGLLQRINELETQHPPQ